MSAIPNAIPNAGPTARPWAPRWARPRRRATLAVLLAASATLGACATYPGPWKDAPAAAAPDTRVYVYPAAGQDDAQMDRDRYDCHLWAVKQTGFDPSSPQLAPHQRVAVVEGPPPGSGTAVGAATGAVIGAATARPRDAGAGLVIGAIAGAIIGTAAEQSANEQAAASARSQARYGLEEQAANYRRAITACLQGRHYTVR